MKRRFVPVLFAALAVLCFALAAEAVEQKALPLTEYLKLYEKPDLNAKYTEFEADTEEWIKVPSAIRDKSGALWYKVNVIGKTGWLFNEGLRLRMGPRSKSAANLCAYCLKKVRAAAAGKAAGWEKSPEVDVDGRTLFTWSLKGGSVIQLLGEKRDFIYFRTMDGKVCRDFLGFNAVGMEKKALRSKIGTPTVRETPEGDRDVVIMSWEAAGSDLTLAISLRNDIVEGVEVYKGETGSEESWPEAVLTARDSGN